MSNTRAQGPARASNIRQTKKKHFAFLAGTPRIVTLSLSCASVLSMSFSPLSLRETPYHGLAAQDADTLEALEDNAAKIARDSR